ETFDALKQSHDELLAAKKQVDRAIADRSAATAGEAAAVDELRAEREALIARLADAESKLARIDFDDVEQLQRRLELAVEDMRTLKRLNAELEEEIETLKATGARSAAPAIPSDDGPNWEAMKRQMMQSLDADGDSNEPPSEERITIENTIMITDELVAQKDRQIAELRQQLAEQECGIGPIAVGAQAVAIALEQDELIKQERAKLVEMQDQWKNKLRQAEIDISVERAKITRDRAEIEDKLASYEKERARQAADGGITQAEFDEKAKKPTRGRWLARLGLKEDE
ncbi:MAG TPA: hypothetical protein VGH32_08150, partial [Pirellulales bacterium]